MSAAILGAVTRRLQGEGRLLDAVQPDAAPERPPLAELGGRQA